MGLSPFLSGALLAASLGGPPVQFGDPPYLALLGAPARASDTGSTLSEPVYGGYQRTPVPWAGWTIDPSGTFAYSPDITLPAWVSGPGAQVIAWALCDSPSGGEWGWSGLCPAFQIDAEDPAPMWAAGAIIINLAAAL